MTFDPNFYQNIFTADPYKLQIAAYGGILLAFATSFYYFLYGRILGMSGLCSVVVSGNFNTQARQKFNILAGMVFASALMYKNSQTSLLAFSPFEHSVTDYRSKLIVAGLLIGMGATIGNGCTSGHGLCGMARLSIRSITAVVVFLITAIITATFNVSKLFGYTQAIDSIPLPANANVDLYLYGTVISMFIFFLFSKNVSFGKFLRTLTYFSIGALFSLGLMIAGMSQRANIFGFLELNRNWNPALLVVLMVGVLINLVVFTLVRKGKQPMFEDDLHDPRGNIDTSLIIGAFLFGVGWGLGGLCPGPFLVQIPLPNLTIPIFWGIPYFIGTKLGGWVKRNNCK